MSNVILFPSCVHVGDWWWHGGKKYKHMGILKKVLSPDEWRRVYEFHDRLFPAYPGQHEKQA